MVNIKYKIFSSAIGNSDDTKKLAEFTIKSLGYQVDPHAVKVIGEYINSVNKLPIEGIISKTESMIHYLYNNSILLKNLVPKSKIVKGYNNSNRVVTDSTKLLISNSMKGNKNARKSELDLISEYISTDNKERRKTIVRTLKRKLNLNSTKEIKNYIESNIEEY